MHYTNELDLRQRRKPEQGTPERPTPVKKRAGSKLYVRALVAGFASVFFAVAVAAVWAWYVYLGGTAVHTTATSTSPFKEAPATQEPAPIFTDPLPSEEPVPVNVQPNNAPAEEPVPAPTPTSSQNTTEPKPTPAPIPTPVPVPTASTLDYSFGIAMAETLSVLSEEELARQLDDVVSLGVGWIRVDLAWNSIQWRDSDSYYWDAFDRIVAEANKREIRVLPIITYTPKWARAEACTYTSKCEPANVHEYAAFTRRAVERYAPHGVYAWEIWNEPNMKMFWAAGASPARYVALLKAAYEAIHAVDPDAIVISGGLAPIGTGGGNITAREFVERMYENGAQGHFDALGFHPYSFPHSPDYYSKSSAWSQMTETEWSLRSIMAEYGDSGEKIWLTEYGAPTGGPGSIASDNQRAYWPIPDHVTENYQAQILRESVEEVQGYDWAGPLFWYSYKDLGTNTGDRENFFGLIRHDGSPKPAYTKLKELLSSD